MGLTLPILAKDQLGPYKEYLLMVNFFIEHFRKNGVLDKGANPANTIDLPGPRLTAFLREKAAEELRAPVTCFHGQEWELLSKATETEKQALMRAIKDSRLDWAIRRNAEPKLTLRKGGSSRFIDI